MLVGLLGNIGVKNEADSEATKGKSKSAPRYLGARNTDFYLFPGSGIAKKSPTWVMSAELVETSRLFARQNARIEPEWIEEAAQHLLKRSYSEPHWSEKQGLVKAYETVTLYGLILHARRSVHYGPVNSTVSRELFIREALVHGNYRTKAAFFANNQELVEEARQLESKTRRPDVLADEETLYQFFDRHVPENVFSHVTFEKWRKEAESKTPNILKLTRDDVFSVAGQSPSEDYPSEITVNNVPFKLQYCFSPGDEDDGVTAIIPLGALNQLDEKYFAWLVPGFLTEKVTSLLKSLPKSIRKQLVPIPEFTKLMVNHLREDYSIVDCSDRDDIVVRLAQLVKDERQIHIKTSDWRMDLLSDHSRMRFMVIDASGKTLGKGRSLIDLKSRLSDQASGEAKTIKMDAAWPESGMTSWLFGDLPKSVDVESGGHKYLLFPAVVDKQTSVGVELIDSLPRAQELHRIGLRRLAALVNAKDVKYVMRHLPSIDAMCLIYSTLGSCELLKEGLLNIILGRSYFPNNEENTLRTEQSFLDCLKRSKPLMPEAKKVCQTVYDTLAVYQSVTKKFTQCSSALPESSRDDMREQLENLIPANFLHTTPDDWLEHLPRYMKALDARLVKISAAPANDLEKLQQVRPLVDAYLSLKDSATAHSFQAELSHLKWMIEEFRVSLFAQALKTSIPISAKRIEKQITKCN